MKGCTRFAFHDALLVIDCIVKLGWLLSDGSDKAFLLLGLLLGARFVERMEIVSCAWASVWTFSQASYADELSLILDVE